MRRLRHRAETVRSGADGNRSAARRPLPCHPAPAREAADSGADMIVGHGAHRSCGIDNCTGSVGVTAASR
nr:hypothetical protein [Sphingomonas bacterium]